MRRCWHSNTSHFKLIITSNIFLCVQMVTNFHACGEGDGMQGVVGALVTV